MPEPTRRDVIAGATLGTLAAVSTEASAGVRMVRPGGAVAEHVARLRERWDRGAEDLGATLLVDRPDCGDAALRADARALRRGFAAVEIYKELELLPVEDQVHAPVQELFADVFAAVGGAVRTSVAWARAWADGEGLRSDPDDQHLHGALGALRLGLRDAKTTYGRQQQLEATLNGAAQDRRPGALRARVRRLLLRAEKADALAERIAAAPGSTDVLRLDDPAVEAKVAAAVAAQEQAEPGAAASPGEPSTGVVVLGMLCLGALLVGGLFVTLLGACSVGCDGGVAGVLVLLLGLALMGLAIWGSIRLLRWAKHGSSAPEAADAGLVPTPLEPAGWVDIDASTGWVPAGVEVQPEVPLVARAWGVVRGGRLWAADAEGDGVAAGMGAPLPGAPARALIGRVGARVFFIGAEQRVPDGVAGLLELRANVPEAHLDLMRGGFTVQLLRATARA